MIVRNFICLVICVLSLPGVASAGSDSSVPGGRDPTGRDLYSQSTGTCSLTGITLLYFPPGDLYPVYAADPFRPGFGVDLVHLSRVEIPDSSASRINLRAGGVLGVLRSVPIDPGATQWQLSFMGGFTAQHDAEFSLDNIGWDGHYGILLTASRTRIAAFKLGLQHDSSHIGDEYIERTGRLRIGYTRQELAAGASWFPGAHMRLYAEAGRAVSLGNRNLQEPWRGQMGLEYESSPLLGGPFRWYTAVDAQTMQERQWRVDVAAQAGIAAHSQGRTWRFGFEWYNGRPPIGEFFQYTERSIGVGLWIDI